VTCGHASMTTVEIGSVRADDYPAATRQKRRPTCADVFKAC
jgi:hypothetical protein